MSPHPYNDPYLDIIKGCIEGDRKSQSRLYDAFSSKMFGICLRYAKDYHQAEDILQDGFVKTFRHISKFRFEGSFEGWLRRIFVNTAIEQIRKNIHVSEIVEHQIDYRYQSDNEGIHNLATGEIMKMVQDLSPGYRTIFNLFAIEGFSHQEIADQLKISEGTSKSQFARARAILMKKVEASAKVAKPATGEQVHATKMKFKLS